MESLLEFTLLEFGAVGGEAGYPVHVVGDHPALGCWSPAQSVPLRERHLGGAALLEDEDTHLGPQRHPAIQYKYLLMKDGLLHRWENFDGNRVCADVQGSSMCLLEDELDKLPLRPAIPPQAAVATQAALGAAPPTRLGRSRPPAPAAERPGSRTAATRTRPSPTAVSRARPRVRWSSSPSSCR